MSGEVGGRGAESPLLDADSCSKLGITIPALKSPQTGAAKPTELAVNRG